MRNSRPRKLRVYRTQNGREPFFEWLKSIRDPEIKTESKDDLTRSKMAI